MTHKHMSTMQQKSFGDSKHWCSDVPPGLRVIQEQMCIYAGVYLKQNVPTHLSSISWFTYLKFWYFLVIPFLFWVQRRNSTNVQKYMHKQNSRKHGKTTWLCWVPDSKRWLGKTGIYWTHPSCFCKATAQKNNTSMTANTRLCIWAWSSHSTRWTGTQS